MLSDQRYRLNIITNLSACDSNKFTAFESDNMDDLHTDLNIYPEIFHILNDQLAHFEVYPSFNYKMYGGLAKTIQSIIFII